MRASMSKQPSAFKKQNSASFKSKPSIAIEKSEQAVKHA
jgi:hypothetical protein